MTRQTYTTLRTQIMIQLVDCLSPMSMNKSTQATKKLNTNHPSDEIMWVLQDNRSVEQWVNEYTNYYVYETDPDKISQEQPLISAQLQFQHQNRTDDRDWRFYRHEMPIISHKNTPSLNVYMYSFSLDPENYQFQGTANFSRIDDVTLNLKLNSVYETENTMLYVFNIHRNFFRIAGSQGGKIYAA